MQWQRQSFPTSVRGCPRIDGFCFGAEFWRWCCNNDDDDDAKAQLRRASNGQNSAELAARYRQEASRCRHVMYKQGTLHAPSIGAPGLGGCGDLDYRDLKVGISVMSPGKSAGVVNDLWMP